MIKHRTNLLMIVALAAGLLTSGFQTTPPEEPRAIITQIDTSEFPRVTLYISVVDAAGNPVEVNPGQLVIEENGVPIESGQIEGVGEVGPLTTLLVTDVSGSMNNGGKLAAAKAAARQYVEQMRPGDQAGLMTFNTSVNLALPVTTDQDALLNAIDSIRAQDNTAMYDALLEAVDLLENVSGRKAIIILTDGLDNISLAGEAEVISQIGPAGLSISTIGLGEPGQSTSAVTALDEAALTSLASNAGGVYGYANDEESLRNLYQQYAVALQSEYVITYQSPASLRDGVNRSLTVSLQDAAGAGLVSAEGAHYNPGGLVPEVAQPAPWSLFSSLLAGLLLLLLVPGLFGWFGGLELFKRKPKTRIKLKD
jgi:VWFA-related protein